MQAKNQIWHQGKQCQTAPNFEVQYLQDIGKITLFYLKSYSVWVFSCKLLQCFQLTLTLKHIRSKGSTSSAEQNYIVTMILVKTVCLHIKLETKYAIKFKERKVPQYSFPQKSGCCKISVVCNICFKFCWQNS